jgi:hypothetical protein
MYRDHYSGIVDQVEETCVDDISIKILECSKVPHEVRLREVLTEATRRVCKRHYHWDTRVAH